MCGGGKIPHHGHIPAFPEGISPCCWFVGLLVAEFRKLELVFSTVGPAANQQPERQETSCKRGNRVTRQQKRHLPKIESTSAEGRSTTEET